MGGKSQIQHQSHNFKYHKISFLSIRLVVIIGIINVNLKQLNSQLFLSAKQVYSGAAKNAIGDMKLW